MLHFLKANKSPNTLRASSNWRKMHLTCLLYYHDGSSCAGFVIIVLIPDYFPSYCLASEPLNPKPDPWGKYLPTLLSLYIYQSPTASLSWQGSQLPCLGGMERGTFLNPLKVLAVVHPDRMPLRDFLELWSTLGYFGKLSDSPDGSTGESLSFFSAACLWKEGRWEGAKASPCLVSYLLTQYLAAKSMLKWSASWYA